MDPYYASRYTFDETRAVAWKEIVRYLRKFITPDMTVLDLGAGYCDFINNVEAKKKYAVDYSPELPRYAAKNVTTIQSSAWEYKQVPNESVDVILASNLFEHLTDEELTKTVAEVRRVLKPKGMLMLMQPNYRLMYKYYFDDPTHKKVFSDAALESFLISHNFSILEKKPRFLPFSLRSRPSFIPPMPWLVRAYINSPIKPFAGQMLFVAQK